MVRRGVAPSVHLDDLHRRLFPSATELTPGVERWMPPTLRGALTRDATRVRVMVRLVVFAAYFLGFFALASLAFREFTHLAFATGFLALELVVLWMFRIGRPDGASRVHFAAVLAGIGFKSWTMGPGVMTTWAWAPLLPVTALAAGGARAAFRWTLAACAVFVGIMALFAAGVRPATPTPNEGILLLLATGLGVIVTIVAITGAFERDMRAAVDEAEARAAALEAARADLEARNALLVEARSRLETLNRELAVARDAAEQGARARSDFLAVMSHEVRTPMNAVMGMTSLMLDTPLSDEQRGFAETIRTSGEALLTLLNDALDYTKIEAGRVVLEALPFDPADEVRQVVDLMRGAAHARGNTLLLTADASLPGAVRSDPGRIRQVLLNLLSNAVKFTHDGEVTVRVDHTREGGRVWLRVSVEDTGIGISPEALAQLFQPFTQADASTTRRFGGTGLGLAISRRVADLLGGVIVVDSEPGRGSKFTLRVPVEAVAPSGEVEIPVRVGTIPGHGQKLRVLVAEDNPVNQKVVSLMLERMGHRVDVVCNGAEALEALARAPYDAVLMDVQMPDIDGVTAARIIRARERGRRTPIIALTANADEAEERRCLDVGMDDFLPKPLRRERLEASLARHINATRVRSSSAPSLPPA
jgi:signal transduction histidine kinase/ActR/RegA family two-component response regulator